MFAKNEHMNGPPPPALDCHRCDGHGRFDDTPCTACHGTGNARCFDCSSPATVADVYPDGDGPACADCAVKCWHGCGSIATQLVKVADDQGDCEEEQPLCDRCADEEEDRAARIRREAQRAAYWDAAEDAA